MVFSGEKLLGQQEVERRFESLLAAGRVPHALLLHGPVGVGKWTFACLLAKRLLCQSPKGLYACDACSACKKVASQVHGDLHCLGLDESSIKIREIRTIEGRLRLRPVEGKSKLLLIRGADKMTVDSQNAILKTLEEPPGNAHLILTSSQPLSLLPTVVSRCQRVPFLPIGAKLIANVLVQRRGMEIAEAQAVATMMHGSLGKALALEPEELLPLRDEIVSVDKTLEPDRKMSAIHALEIAAEFGHDRKAFAHALDLLGVWLRDQALVAAQAGEDIANADLRDEVVRLAKERGLAVIVHRAQFVLETQRRLSLPYNLNCQMLAEQLCLGLAGHVSEMPPLSA